MPDPNSPEPTPPVPPDPSVYGTEWGGSGKGAGAGPQPPDRPQRIDTPPEHEGQGETESPPAAP